MYDCDAHDSGAHDGADTTTSSARSPVPAHSLGGPSVADHEVTQRWAGESGRTTADLHVVGGVSVVTVTGSLDHTSVQPVRAALDVATNWESIAVDLSHTDPPDSTGLSTLGGMRRYVRARQATMTLTAVPWPWLDALASATILDLYEFAPSVTQLVERLTVSPAEPPSSAIMHRRASRCGSTPTDVRRHEFTTALHCA